MKSRIIVVASSIGLGLGLLVGLASTVPSSASPRVSNGTGISKLTVVELSTDIQSPDPAWGGSSLNLETTMPLLTYYPRVNGLVGALAPGLATVVPKPTNKGTTYEFHLRPGVKYSNGQPILASDVEYEIERVYLANDYPGGNFDVIKGASAFQKAKKGNISGIIADNANWTITFNLTAPSPTFDMLMAQYYSAPVPANTSPTSEDNQVPSTGPMMVKQFTVSQSYTLVKNPYFMPTASLHASNVDEIVATAVSNPNVLVLSDAERNLRLRRRERPSGPPRYYLVEGCQSDRDCSPRGDQHVLVERDQEAVQQPACTRGSELPDQPHGHGHPYGRSATPDREYPASD